MLARWHRWSLILTIPLMLLFTFTLDIFDPSINSQIRAEAGNAYFLHCYVAIIAAFILSLFGAIRFNKKLR
jgi:hypothetical protein